MCSFVRSEDREIGSAPQRVPPARSPGLELWHCGRNKTCCDAENVSHGKYVQFVSRTMICTILPRFLLFDAEIILRIILQVILESLVLHDAITGESFLNRPDILQAIPTRRGHWPKWRRRFPRRTDRAIPQGFRHGDGYSPARSARRPPKKEVCPARRFRARCFPAVIGSQGGECDASR